MAQVTGQQAAADRLARLVERVRDWRSTRVRRSPMPAILWEEAVRLGQQLGVHPVKAAQEQDAWGGGAGAGDAGGAARYEHCGPDGSGRGGQPSSERGFVATVPASVTDKSERGA
jgi:hypothetical protein